MRSFVLMCAIGCFALVSNNAVAGEIVYTSDFNSGMSGFTGGSIQTSPNDTMFLAPGAPGASTTLTLTGLDPHTEVTLSFTLDAVGSLDGGPNPANGGGLGDFFDVTYSSASSSNVNVFNHTFANYDGGNTQDYPILGSAPTTGATTINGLGYTNFPSVGDSAQDSEYDLTLAPITDSNGTISFTFTDNSNEGFGNEFYGIDNVVVTTDATAGNTPEPATFALVALGLCMLPIARRRRQS
jgi:hypothetical protein